MDDSHEQPIKPFEIGDGQTTLHSADYAPVDPDNPSRIVAGENLVAGQMVYRDEFTGKWFTVKPRSTHELDEQTGNRDNE